MRCNVGVRRVRLTCEERLIDGCLLFQLQKPVCSSTRDERISRNLSVFCCRTGLAGAVAPPTTHACEPIFTNDKHKDEGYALDWSKLVPGQIATGDCKNAILRCKNVEG